MRQELIPFSEEPSRLGLLAEAANEATRKNVLVDYQKKMSLETLRRQKADVALFEQYLAEAGVSITGMVSDLTLWREVSYGLVEGFVRWQLLKGYAIGSVNVRLATIHRYCSLALKAQCMDPQQYTMIKTVTGMRGIEGRNIDEKRETRRIGRKKEVSTLIASSHVDAIKQSLRERADEDALRDLALFCLFVDLGLRCGEVSILRTKNIDLNAGMLKFYRRKVHKEQTHKLTPDALLAFQKYLKVLKEGDKIFPGEEQDAFLSTRTINRHIGALGRFVEIPNLSPHDLRHYWATHALTQGTDIGALQQAGGWSNPFMPLRYREDSRIANEGVKL